MQTTRRLEFGVAPPRPIHHPALGEFFSQFKRSHGWSADAERAARGAVKYPALTRQVLLRLGAGKTKWPDPEVLRQFAAFYAIPFDALVAEVVRHTYGVSLSPAGVDTSRLVELERLLVQERDARQKVEARLARLEAAFRPDDEKKPPDRKAAGGRRTG